MWIDYILAEMGVILLYCGITLTLLISAVLLIVGLIK